MNLNDIVAGLPEWWPAFGLVVYSAGTLVTAVLLTERYANRLSQSLLVWIFFWPIACPIMLVTWPLRRVWRWWRGRRKRGKGVLLIPVTVHDDGRAATAAIAYHGNHIRLNARWHFCYETTSGDARAGDGPVGSDPSEPPPVADSAAGRPYGSAPPVNRTVERVDELERRVAGLEKMARAQFFKKWLDDSQRIAAGYGWMIASGSQRDSTKECQRAYRDHGCGSSEIVRFFPSHKAFVIHPPEWAHSVYDESYCIKTGMYRMGDAEALKIWKQRPPETIRVCKAGAELVLYDPRGNWWRKTATGWHEVARPSLTGVAVMTDSSGVR